MELFSSTDFEDKFSPLPPLQDTLLLAVNQSLPVSGSPYRYSCRLAWTASGDDGNVGTASQYDIRYLEGTPITANNWNSAVQATGEAAPKAAGSAETFTVSGLQSGKTYYFAIKTGDEVPNWSAFLIAPPALPYHLRLLRHPSHHSSFRRRRRRMVYPLLTQHHRPK
jgi:hypothetical protein